MNTQKAETRFKHLARDIQPLATHLEQFRPSVHSIRIRRDDWELLRKEAEAARAQGFIVSDDGVRYRNFELQPTDTYTARHPR